MNNLTHIGRSIKSSIRLIDKRIRDNNNFKIIMTYNISTFYAMVVANLSKEIAAGT